MTQSPLPANPSNFDRSSNSTAPNSDLLYVAAWAMLAAFGCYFCMYGFRKPFTAAGYEETTLWGTGFKTILVTSQVLGYTISKFVGIKVVSEIPPQRRAIGVLGLILVAQLALVAYGLVPRPWNAICLFINGLPLGMVFGLVLGFLEGRQLTEALTAGLCTSFILAGGVTKSVGTWLLNCGVPEDWMPATAGAIYLLPLMVCVWLLSRIPPPTMGDQAARTSRSTMNRTQRWSFFRRYWLGLTSITVIYFVLTILRSLRDDFAPEIWAALGAPANADVFSRSEFWVALGVTIVNGSIVFVYNNRLAFFCSLITCAFGFSLLTVSILLQSAGTISSFWFMVLMGLGLYFPYVAIHTTLFERMIALTRERGTIAFLMYLVDSVGYLGYVAVLLLKNYLGTGKINMLDLLIGLSWVAVVVAAIGLAATAWAFTRIKSK